MLKSTLGAFGLGFVLASPSLAWEGGNYHINSNQNVDNNFNSARANSSASATGLGFGGNARAFGGSATSSAFGGKANSTVVNNVGNGHVPWWGYGGAVAPSLSGGVGNGVCASQVGLSLGFIGTFGVLIPVADAPCNARADYLTYRGALPRKVYHAYPYANSEAVRAAYRQSQVAN